MSRRRTTSNQLRNNAVHVIVEVCNVEQRRINVTYFNVDLNNVRQRWNNVAIFSVDFHNAGQRWNNVVNMTIWKKIKPQVKKIYIYFWTSKNTLYLKSSSFYSPFYKEYVKGWLQGRKILKTWSILHFKNYI